MLYRPKIIIFAYKYRVTFLKVSESFYSSSEPHRSLLSNNYQYLFQSFQYKCCFVYFKMPSFRSRLIEAQITTLRREVTAMRRTLEQLQTSLSIRILPEIPRVVSEDQVDDLLSLIVGEDDIGANVSCPVCLEDFELDADVKQLPCKVNIFIFYQKYHFFKVKKTNQHLIFTLTNRFGFFYYYSTFLMCIAYQTGWQRTTAARCAVH